jgi:hypothetical protein
VPKTLLTNSLRVLIARAAVDEGLEEARLGVLADGLDRRGAGLVADAGQDGGRLRPGLRLVEGLEPLVELGELGVDFLVALLGEQVVDLGGLDLDLGLDGRDPVLGDFLLTQLGGEGVNAGGKGFDLAVEFR